MSRIKTFREYYTGEPISELIQQLSDPILQFDRDREKVNDLVMNLVTSYLIEYLHIQHASLKELRRKLKRALDNQIVSRSFDDSYPLGCLSDTKQTSGCLKEVAFNSNFQAKDRFVGVDLGSGTGILMLGMVIAAMRKGIQDISCIGIEENECAVENANVALGEIRNTLPHIRELKLRKADATEKAIWNDPKLRETSFWTSETINSATTRIPINGNSLIIKAEEQIDFRAIGDPYPLILLATAEGWPEFFDSVKNGKVAMFPDVINGSYKPGEENPLALLTGKDQTPIPLEKAGIEFTDYEMSQGAGSRW